MRLIIEQTTVYEYDEKGRRKIKETKKTYTDEESLGKMIQMFDKKFTELFK